MSFSPDFGEATVIPHQHFWQGRMGGSARVVVVHGTAGPGSAADIAHYFQTTDRQTGTHYVIDQKGAIVQCVAEVDSAWGNGIVSAGHDKMWDGLTPGNPNCWTISIEHVKPHTDNSDQLTAAQKAASFRLIKDICRRHSIPAKMATDVHEGGITGHYSVDPVNRARCPGPYPWDELLAYLADFPPQDQGAAPGDDMFPQGVPHGWEDDGEKLTFPGKPVVPGGFRRTVLDGWDPSNYPMSDVVEDKQCDPLDPNSGFGWRQYFRDTVLVQQKASGRIWRMHLGKYALALEMASKTKKTPAQVAGNSD